MSAAAENVIGGLLIDSSAYWRVASIVKPEDFDGELRGLFVRIAEAVRKGERYDAVDAKDDGYESAVELATLTASVAGIERWARRVADCSETGRVRNAGERIAQCNSYAEAQDLLGAVRPEQAARVKSVKDGLAEMVETLQARFESGGKVTGVPTGVGSLDELTGGWQPGNLIVLVGETSMGKSALALQCALAAAQYGRDRDQSSLYFSLEMTAGELTERAVANLANFPLRWMTSPADAPSDGMDYVSHGSRLLSELPLMIDDQCGLSLAQIESRATQLHMERRLSAIFVDYMHIMDRPRRNDVSELGGIAIGLKNLSKRLEIPVIALHQLNRSNNAPGRDRRPTLFDIRASGEIAETANTVIAIYRSEIARPDYAPLIGSAEALILKQRQGRRDVRAWMRSRLGNMRLDSMEAPEGYDETICKDHEPAGQVGAVASGGGVPTRRTHSGQPRELPRTGPDM